MRILLNWFPPAFTDFPSPSLSILKGYLTKVGYESDIIYWNLILNDILNDIKKYNREESGYEVSMLFPFLSVILQNAKDNNTFKRLSTFYQAHLPQLINMGNDFHYNTLKETGEKIIERFTQVIHRIHEEKNYSLIGVSTTLMQLIPANIFADISKKITPTIPIVAGGMTHREGAVSSMVNFNSFDFAIWGEGENPLHQLCRYINKEIPIDEVPSLVYREENEIITTRLNNFYNDLDSTKQDLTDYFNYIKANNISDIVPLVPIESSRGCHWKQCKFCYLTTGYKNRRKSNDEIINEIYHAIDTYNQYYFVFLDNDIVFNDYKKFDDLLNKLIKIKDKYDKFSIFNAELLTMGFSSSLIKKMSLAGFKSIQIGYEAVSDSLLRKIHKKNTFSSNLLFIKWCRQYQIALQGLNVITGLLGETEEDIIESIQNMHYLRFFLEPNVAAQNTLPLQVMKVSRYYKIIEKKKELDLWKTNLLYSFFPPSYISEDTKFNLMSFSCVDRNDLWLCFEEIDKHYNTNDYSYKVIKVDDDNVQYIETFNGKPIKKIGFNVNEYHWKILCNCNHEVKSFSELAAIFNIENNRSELEILKCSLNELKEERLLYSNPELSENISVINPDIAM